MIHDEIMRKAQEINDNLAKLSPEERKHSETAMIVLGCAVGVVAIVVAALVMSI